MKKILILAPLRIQAYNFAAEKGIPHFDFKVVDFPDELYGLDKTTTLYVLSHPELRHGRTDQIIRAATGRVNIIFCEGESPYAEIPYPENPTAA